ncbi:unnamed protein product [Chrysodeixis includens]|uniref:Uncharacterized protein n=1 Tax=Chrysodeixis includens TaxID=689277 RepID=A0A9N8Q0E7_CHRIL|nr:unnamed protein product [Chrysodeixis includens]
METVRGAVQCSRAMSESIEVCCVVSGAAPAEPPRRSGRGRCSRDVRKASGMCCVVSGSASRHRQVTVNAVCRRSGRGQCSRTVGKRRGVLRGERQQPTPGNS